MTEASFSVNQLFTGATPAEHISEVDEQGERLGRIVADLNEEERLTFFEIPSTIEWIKENNFERIALQFPDSFLKHARVIAKELETRTGAKTFILADTSYRSCCIDEVAAAHANCDALVHYGDACLSAPTQNIAVKYVLGLLPINLSEFASGLSANCEIEEDRIALLTDAPYSHALKSLADKVECTLGKRPIVCDVLENSIPEDRIVSVGRLIPSDFASISSVCVVFLGDPASPLLPLWLMTHPQCSKVIHFDPTQVTTQVQSSSSWRQLRKRLFLVEKLRDANTVGLVVGSVGVRGHREAVTRMRELCKTSQKKIYVISVGKVNVPKLSNFSSDIDVFVLLSCPFGVILDPSEFYRPVLSMFEAEVALNPERTWVADKGWTSDFGEFVQDKIGAVNENAEEDGDVSLITGRIRARVAETQSEKDQGGAVALYTAGDYFKERSWRGLDDGICVDESTEITEGRAGIAAGYTCENKK